MHGNSRCSIVVDGDQKSGIFGRQKDSVASQGNSSQLDHKASISREESISSTGRSSFHNIIPNIMRSFDSTSSNSLLGSSSFGTTSSFSGELMLPRYTKTVNYCRVLLSTLHQMFDKYSNSHYHDESVLNEDYTITCLKLQERIGSIETLQDEYCSKMQLKEAELEKIQSSMASIKPHKNFDCGDYFLICRDMCSIESTLEKYGGKLQFQIMNLESNARITAFDQYELTVRSPSDSSQKFRTRIKIEKSNHQIWDNRNFSIVPCIEDELQIKFGEIRSLNKTTLPLEKKLTNITELITIEPSIYSVWVTPLGSVKLKVIVQWNAMMDNLQQTLSQQSQQRLSVQDSGEMSVRTRSNSGGLRPSGRGATNFSRNSTNLESLGSRISDKNFAHSSDNILDILTEESSKQSLDMSSHKEKISMSSNDSLLSIQKNESMVKEGSVDMVDVEVTAKTDNPSNSIADPVAMSTEEHDDNSETDRNDTPSQFPAAVGNIIESPVVQLCDNGTNSNNNAVPDTPDIVVTPDEINAVPEVVLRKKSSSPSPCLIQNEPVWLDEVAEDSATELKSSSTLLTSLSEENVEITLPKESEDSLEAMKDAPEHCPSFEERQQEEIRSETSGDLEEDKNSSSSSKDDNTHPESVETKEDVDVNVSEIIETSLGGVLLENMYEDGNKIPEHQVEESNLIVEEESKSITLPAEISDRSSSVSSEKAEEENCPNQDQQAGYSSLIVLSPPLIINDNRSSVRRSVTCSEKLEEEQQPVHQTTALDSDHPSPTSMDPAHHTTAANHTPVISEHDL